MENVHSKLLLILIILKLIILMGSSDSKSISTYSFSFPSNDFSIHGIYPDERQLLG